MIIPIEELAEGQKTILDRLSQIEKILSTDSLKKYSPQDIAKNTPIGIQTVWAAIKDGRIKAERFGRKYLITQEEFERVCKDAKSLKYQRTV